MRAVSIKAIATVIALLLLSPAADAGQKKRRSLSRELRAGALEHLGEHYGHTKWRLRLVKPQKDAKSTNKSLKKRRRSQRILQLKAEPVGDPHELALVSAKDRVTLAIVFDRKAPKGRRVGVVLRSKRKRDITQREVEGLRELLNAELRRTHDAPALRGASEGERLRAQLGLDPAYYYHIAQWARDLRDAEQAASER